MSGIAKVKYTHEALIDAIIAEPATTQRELARIFAYTEGWMSQIMSSDSFKVRLAARKAELVDPLVIRQLEDQLEGLAKQAVSVLVEQLDVTKKPDLAIKALEISTRALGYGARDKNQVNIQNNYVVALPPKAQNAQEWVKEHVPPAFLPSMSIDTEIIDVEAA